MGPSFLISDLRQGERVWNRMATGGLVFLKGGITVCQTSGLPFPDSLTKENSPGMNLFEP